MSASLDPMMPRAHTPIPTRKTYIPEWGTVHSDTGRQLLNHGNPTGFTVVDVLPERRWAVNPDGEIMAQREFEPLYQRWISIACLPNGNLVAIGAVNKDFNPGFESPPRATDFVMKTLDSSGNYVPLGWKEGVEAPTGPRLFFDSSGENPRTARETLNIYRARGAMDELEKMKPLKGVLSDGMYSAKQAEVLSRHGLNEHELAEGLATAPTGFELREVSREDIQRLEGLAAQEEAAEAPTEPEPVSQEVGPADLTGGSSAPAPTFTARCGKACKTNAGRAAHERKCAVCSTPEPPMGEAA